MRYLLNAMLGVAVVQDLLGAIQGMAGQMPFLVALSPEERKKLPKTGRKRLGFVQKAAEVVRQNPGICPPDFDSNGFLRSADLMGALMTVFLALQKLYESMSDTTLESGVDSYTQALDVYHFAKRMAKKVPGLDMTVAEMKKLLKGPPETDAARAKRKEKRTTNLTKTEEQPAKANEPAKQ